MTLSFFYPPLLVRLVHGQVRCDKKNERVGRKGGKEACLTCPHFPNKKSFFSCIKNVAGICFACPKKETFLYIIACSKHGVPKQEKRMFLHWRSFCPIPPPFFPLSNYTAIQQCFLQCRRAGKTCLCFGFTTKFTLKT